MTLRRRTLLGLVPAVLAARVAAQGPAPAKVQRIGFLSASPVDGPLWDAFVGGMRERGWVEGRNVAFLRLTSGGYSDRFPALVAELVRLDVAVIVAAGTPPAIAARDGTTTTPIVFYAAGDPMGSGLVESLARPGRNLTGTGGVGAGQHVKQLELLKEVVPNASRVAMFANDAFPFHTAVRGEIEPAARRLGVALQPIQVEVPEDIDSAFVTVARDKLDALFILGQPLIAAESMRIATLALEGRIPAISPFDMVTEAGLLLSYASRLIDDLRRIPHYIDRILKGAKPADLPVEQPTRFYLVINLKTAAAIGVSVPRSTLARADRLIQ